MSILNNNWFNLNSTRRYPVDDFATGETDSGIDMPNDIITDARIRFPRSAGKFASISSITCSSKIITVTFVGHEHHPNEASTSSSSAYSEGFQPLAVISLPKPVTPNTPYPIRALTNGVFGWIVFGEGIEKEFSGRFSTSGQAVLLPKLAYSYSVYPVTSLSVLDNQAKLTKDVTLRGIGDLKITKESRYIDGIGTTDAMVFRLENQAATSGIFEKYIGPCQGRPESDSCMKESVQYINDIYPDCNGNIDINFSQNGLHQKEIISSDLVGIALEMPLGLAEACTSNDYLPDSFGNLPNTYPDVCEDVAASEGDQDATAEILNLIDANQSLSSAHIDTTALPYTDTMARDPGAAAPYRIEEVKGGFEYYDSVYDRGFPENDGTKGWIVTSPGSRSLAIWNDESSHDRVFAKDISLVTTGARASVTLMFSPLSSLGSGGVVLDFGTSYVPSCDKYVKTYFLGAVDFSTKTLKILYWNGFSFEILASSLSIQGVSPGEWYSLDFQKDTADVAAGGIKYKLRMYTSESYWTNTATSSSLWAEVGSTPYSGYSTSIDAGVIRSVEVYAPSNGTNNYCGVGTITGKPTFSYFFVA
jgi:hypothetical protein